MFRAHGSIVIGVPPVILTIKHQTVDSGGPVKLSMFFSADVFVGYNRRCRGVVIDEVSSEAVFIALSHVFPFWALCGMIWIGNMDFYFNPMYFYTKIK